MLCLRNVTPVFQERCTLPHYILFIYAIRITHCRVLCVRGGLHLSEHQYYRARFTHVDACIQMRLLRIVCTYLTNGFFLQVCHQDVITPQERCVTVRTTWVQVNTYNTSCTCTVLRDDLCRLPNHAYYKRRKGVTLYGGSLKYMFLPGIRCNIMCRTRDRWE